MICIFPTSHHRKENGQKVYRKWKDENCFHNNAYNICTTIFDYYYNNSFFFLNILNGTDGGRRGWWHAVRAEGTGICIVRDGQFTVRTISTLLASGESRILSARAAADGYLRRDVFPDFQTRFLAGACLAFDRDLRRRHRPDAGTGR